MPNVKFKTSNVDWSFMEYDLSDFENSKLTPAEVNTRTQNIGTKGGAQLEYCARLCQSGTGNIEKQIKYKFLNELGYFFSM